MGLNHGTYSTYKHHHCRCEPCRTAHYRYRKARRLGSATPGRIDATGTRRRIHALYRMGWDGATLAPLLGVTTVQAVSALTTRATVTAHTARRVAVVYDQLCMKVGPSVKARQMATKRGLPSPLAWDDIDDPDESPNFGRYEAGLGEDFDEAVRVLTREGWSAARIAEHLGASERTVVRARTRGRVA